MQVPVLKDLQTFHLWRTSTSASLEGLPLLLHLQTVAVCLLCLQEFPMMRLIVVFVLSIMMMATLMMMMMMIVYLKMVVAFVGAVFPLSRGQHCCRGGRRCWSIFPWKIIQLGTKNNSTFPDRQHNDHWSSSCSHHNTWGQGWPTCSLTWHPRSTAGSLMQKLQVVYLSIISLPCIFLMFMTRIKERQHGIPEVAGEALLSFSVRLEASCAKNWALMSDSPPAGEGGHW